MLGFFNLKFNMIMNEKIYILKQDNYNYDEIFKAVEKIFNFYGGVGNFVKPGETVLLKTNLVACHDIERRITTDPNVVKAVAEILINHGAKPFIADSPGIDNFNRTAQKAGIKKIADELNIKCIELVDPVNLNITSSNADYKNIQVSRSVIEADKIISLAKMKTHGQMLLTLGVKNLFGCVPGRLKSGWHYNVGLNRERFAALLLDIYLNVKPVFTIVDGVIGMDGDGPTSGDPYNFNILAGACDALKLDFWLCKFMGAKFEEYPLYNAALKKNLPECNLNPEDLAGDLDQNFKFENVNIPETRSMRLLPKIPFIEKLMTSKPVHIPEKCIGCGRCEEMCAAGALKHHNKKLTFDYSKCIRCYCCHEMCPVKAIEFKQSWLVKLLSR